MNGGAVTVVLSIAVICAGILLLISMNALITMVVPLLISLMTGGLGAIGVIGLFQLVLGVVGIIGIFDAWCSMFEEYNEYLLTGDLDAAESAANQAFIIGCFSFAEGLIQYIQDGKYIIRLLDNIKDGEFIDRVNAMKNLLPDWAKNSGNFGYAETNINGLDKKQYFAHSGIQNEIESVKNIGISCKPETSPLKALSVNSDNLINGEGAWLRDVDTEYKILSDIQKLLGENKNIRGKIKLYTELEPCPSCKYVIQQFKEMYPKLEIEIVYKIKK
ncbi:MAG: deaminase domain-containing protein [Lachnospiraceae bacterium]